MASQKLEIPTVTLKWTPLYHSPKESDPFEFNGARWKLELMCLDLWYNSRDFEYRVYLHRVSSDACRRPFRVSVELVVPGGGESAEATMVSNVDDSYICLLIRTTEELKRAIPVFAEWTASLQAQVSAMTFLVVLKAEGDTAEEDFVGDSRPASNIVRFRNQEILVRDFSRMLEDQDSLTDVEFRFPGGQSTRAHAVVVSARSSVMAAMLSSDMVEGRTRVVQIPNMEHGVFQHFLRYLYSGTLPELTVELALSLFEGGDQYAMAGLVQVCTEYLRQNLTVQNACDVLVVADSHQHAELKEAVLEYMVDQKVPWTSDRWREFCQAHPMLAIGVYDRFRPQ